MRCILYGLIFVAFSASIAAAPPRVLPYGQLPKDKRLSELRTLNSYFPFSPIGDPSDWPERRASIKRRILLSQGLWPMPTKPDLNTVVHGRVERDDYTVDRVFFESIPGHFVTGSLYRPKNMTGPFPAILSPHGHWENGRFYDAGADAIRADLARGAERFEIGGRFPIQARAVQLARMGCVVFIYDMTGNADSIQIGHRPDKASHLDRDQDWGFFSAQAELRLQNMMGLQTWNSVRALDFVLQLDDVDSSRIGVTGGSGGGTQSMIIGAIDDRITAAMPCVMVSTSMQGGCTCENAPYLRINQGNVDIAAAIAPRPLGLTAADDWTIELETKGYPDLRQLYSDLGQQSRLTAAFNVQFKHNYNHVNRTVMYGFFNRHFELGLKEPVLERDFVPLSRDEATVWSGRYPAPSGSAIGDEHETRLLRDAADYSERRLNSIVPDEPQDLPEYLRVIGGAWETIIGRTLDAVLGVNSTQVVQSQVNRYLIERGLLNHDGEQLPYAMIFDPSVSSRGTVVWVSDEGKQSLFQGDGVGPDIAKFVNAGYRVISADLFMQGEFSIDGETMSAQRMWHQRDGNAAWMQFSGYTYGYNHPLFVKRSHDVLTLVKYVSSNQADTIILAGIGTQSGPIVAAARSQAFGVIGRAFIDTKGFRFESLTRQDDPMFVPGAVKYLDIDGLLSLSATEPLDLVGAPNDVVQRVAQASGTSGDVHWHTDEDALVRAIISAQVNESAR